MEPIQGCGGADQDGAITSYSTALHCIRRYCVVVLHRIVLYFIRSDQRRDGADPRRSRADREVLHFIAVYCTVLYCIVWHRRVLHCMVWYGIPRHGIALIVLHCITLHCIEPSTPTNAWWGSLATRAVLYCIALHCLVVCCIVLSHQHRRTHLLPPSPRWWSAWWGSSAPRAWFRSTLETTRPSARSATSTVGCTLSH